MRGIDVSGWQGSMNFSDWDFVMMKASEGNGFKDKMLDKHYDNLHGSSDGKPDKKKCYGFYHYARPDLGNSPEEEAQWFLSLVGHHAGYAMLALDWEGESLKYGTDWALRWLDYVHAKTGVKPLIYIQGSQEWTGNYNAIRDRDYGLWIAHWGVNSPVVKNWPFYAMWQYQGSPLDTNLFNGDESIWRLYCQGERVYEDDVYTPAEDGKWHIGDWVTPMTVYDYNGTKNDDWVLRSIFAILEIKGDRIVIGDKNTAEVTGVWKKEDLKQV